MTFKTYWKNLVLNNPSKVILHCSDTEDYLSTHLKFDLIGASDIKEWHLSKGWDDIGYHYVIRRTGVIEAGRKESVIGSHCKSMNVDSLGVCYVGRSKPTREQIKSIIELYSTIFRKYKIPANMWFCHHQFNKNKTCPGFSVELLRMILELSEAKA